MDRGYEWFSLITKKNLNTCRYAQVLTGYYRLLYAYRYMIYYTIKCVCIYIYYAWWKIKKNVFINGNVNVLYDHRSGSNARAYVVIVCVVYEWVCVVRVWEVVLAHWFSQWTLLTAATARPFVSGTRQWTHHSRSRRRRLRSRWFSVSRARSAYNNIILKTLFGVDSNTV